MDELTEITATAPQATAEIPDRVEEITWPAHEPSDMFDGAKETASFPEEPAEIPPDVEVALPAVTTLPEFPVESISLEPPVGRSNSFDCDSRPSARKGCYIPI